MSKPSTALRRGRAAVAFLAVALMILVSCGGGGGSSDASSSQKDLFGGDGIDIQPPPQGGGNNPDAGFTPKRGGAITYATEAESTGGYCLPQAQLAISGEQVARSVYDTLTVPSSDGKYHPYLAKQITHSPDYMTWHIELRPNITFHDGSPLTAEVVKNNLDAYRGQYPKRDALLFIFVLKPIESITVTGPLTLDIGLKKPWINFKAVLFAQGRLGIMAQAQLDAPTASCQYHLIGTGPFMPVSDYRPGQPFVLERNPHYWQMAPDGKLYPYLDKITYIKIPDTNARNQALEADNVQIIHQSGGTAIAQLRDLAADGNVRLITSIRWTELGYLMLNVAKPPFDDINARIGAAEAIDYDAINKAIGKNVTPLASGPFPPNSPGYVANTGFPRYNPADAKKRVQAYRDAHGGKAPTVVISSTPVPTVIRTVQLIQSYMAEAGFDVTYQQYEQSQLINQAVSGNFQMAVFRNHAGIDPDEQYVWWHSGSPVNFGNIEDPVIDCLLDVGRTGQDPNGCLDDPALNQSFPGLSKLDPSNRPPLYQALNRRFADQVYNIWGAYTAWTVATQPPVHGVFGPKLPDGAEPWDSLANGNPVLGMWVGSATPSGG